MTHNCIAEASFFEGGGNCELYIHCVSVLYNSINLIYCLTTVCYPVCEYCNSNVMLYNCTKLKFTHRSHLILYILVNSIFTLEKSWKSTNDVIDIYIV